MDDQLERIRANHNDTLVPFYEEIGWLIAEIDTLRRAQTLAGNGETTAHALRHELLARDTKLERVQRLYDKWAVRDPDTPMYELWKALGNILSGQLTLPCDVCDGAGTVECWNPGGPCPRPNDPECTVCGPCRTCGGG